jgi:hypothetical protein
MKITGLHQRIRMQNKTYTLEFRDSYMEFIFMAELK